MKIKSIHLKDFKRFKDLTISDLPESAKLIVLVGPNGCGKSSVFEAMNVYTKNENRVGKAGGVEYYSKNSVLENAKDWQRDINNGIEVTIHKPQPINKKSFYIRSAYRHVSSFTQSNIKKIDEDSHLNNRLPRLIDADKEIEVNYSRLIWRAASAVFMRENADKKAGDIANEITSVVSSHLENILPALQLDGLSELNSGKGTFIFTKGDSRNYSYENLSSGEKATFDLLLDMAIKRKTHTDTVYCIDEPESHLGLGAQKNVLNALFNMLPSESQLWIGTHSIGMMREAYRLQCKEPDKVVFLNFDGLDFDKPQEIKPAQMNRALWEKIHSTSLDDLADLVFPDTLYLCESTPEKSFDADCYNTIFSEKYPNTKFVSIGSKTDVKRIAMSFKKEMPNLNISPVRDRDQMSEAEVKQDRSEGVKILSRTCIEKYLLDDEVLAAFCTKHNFLTNVLNEIKKIRDTNENEPKRTCQNIRTHLVNLNRSLQIGDNTEAFLKYSLAPLLSSDMQVYKELKQDIFEE